MSDKGFWYREKGKSKGSPEDEKDVEGKNEKKRDKNRERSSELRGDRPNKDKPFFKREKNELKLDLREKKNEDKEIVPFKALFTPSHKFDYSSSLKKGEKEEASTLKKNGSIDADSNLDITSDSTPKLEKEEEKKGVVKNDDNRQQSVVLPDKIEKGYNKNSKEKLKEPTDKTLIVGWVDLEPIRDPKVLEDYKDNKPISKVQENFVDTPTKLKHDKEALDNHIIIDANDLELKEELFIKENDEELNKISEVSKSLEYNANLSNIRNNLIEPKAIKITSEDLNLIDVKERKKEVKEKKSNREVNDNPPQEKLKTIQKLHEKREKNEEINKITPQRINRIDQPIDISNIDIKIKSIEISNQSTFEEPFKTYKLNPSKKSQLNIYHLEKNSSNKEEKDSNSKEIESNRETQSEIENERRNDAKTETKPNSNEFNRKEKKSNIISKEEDVRLNHKNKESCEIWRNLQKEALWIKYLRVNLLKYKGEYNSEETKALLNQLLYLYKNCRYCYKLKQKLNQKRNNGKLTNEDVKLLEKISKFLKSISPFEEEIFKSYVDFRRRFYNKQMTKNQVYPFLEHLYRKLNALQFSKDWKDYIKNHKELLQNLGNGDVAHILQILNKDEIDGDDIKLIASKLSILETKQLIEIFGYLFKLHTHNYIRWGFDFYPHVKQQIIIDFIEKNRSLRRFSETSIDGYHTQISKNKIINQPTSINEKALFEKLENWKGSSPYYPYFRKFIEDLVKLLNNFGILTTNNLNELEEVVSIGKSGIHGMLWSLKEGSERNHFNIGEETLDKWFIQLQMKITQSRLKINKGMYLKDLHGLFNDYYRISGMNSSNVLYKPFRMMIAQLVEYLYQLNLIQEINYKSLDTLIGIRGFCSKSFYKLKNDFNFIPQNIITFKTSLLKNIEPMKLPLNQIKRIKDIINEFLSEIAQKNEINDLLVDYKDSPFKKLIHNLMSLDNVFGQIGKKSVLARLYFQSYDVWKKALPTLNSNAEPVRLPLYKIWRIVYCSQMWTVKTFTDKGLNIEIDMLEKLKEQIKLKIDEWVFENPYKEPYVCELPTRKTRKFYKIQQFEKNYQYSEYELIQLLWMACVAYTNNLSFSFSQMNKRLNYKNLRNVLSQGDVNINIDKLKGILLTINKWAGEEAKVISQNTKIKGMVEMPYSYKMKIYRRVMDEISEYIGIHRCKRTILH